MNWNEIIKPFISKKLEEREIEIMREQIIQKSSHIDYSLGKKVISL